MREPPGSMPVAGLPARWLGLPLALIALSYLALPNATVDFTRFNADDSGFYLALGESLAQGRGFTLYQAPLHAPSNVWPPVFPLFLSGVIALFGLDLLALKIAMALLGLAALYAVYLFFTRVHATPWALTIVALTAVSPWYFSFSHQVLADVPILLCLVLALACLDRWCRQGCPFGGSAFWTSVAAVTLAYMTKPQAIVLLVVPWVRLLVDRKATPRPSALRVIGFCCVAGVVFAAWAVRGAWLERTGHRQDPQIHYVPAAAPSEASTASGVIVQLGDVLGRPAGQIVKTVMENAKWHLPQNLAELVAPPLALLPWRSGPVPGWAALLLSGALFAPVAYGWVVLWRRRELVVTTFYAAHLFLVLTATYYANPRYLVCLIPFTFFYFLVGLDALPAPRWLARGAAATLLLLGGFALAAHLDHVREHPYATPAQSDFVDAARWSQRSLEPNAVILGHNWSELHVLSGRSTYPMLSPPGVGPEPWLEISRRPIYLLVPKAEAFAAIAARDKGAPSWRRWLEAHPSRRTLAFENAYYRIERLDELPLAVVRPGS